MSPPPGEPASDPCSRCGRPVRRALVLHVDEALPASGPSKNLCASCLNRRGIGRKIGGFLGAANGFLDYLLSIYWLAAFLIVLTLAALVGLFGRK